VKVIFKPAVGIRAACDIWMNNASNTWTTAQRDDKRKSTSSSGHKKITQGHHVVVTDELHSVTLHGGNMCLSVTALVVRRMCGIRGLAHPACSMS
jgi:hypothetical protein